MNQIIPSPAAPPMRRSSRRKNKFLHQQETHYQIPNPFKMPLSQQCIPETLSEQLSHLQFLSTRSLKNLSFPEAESYSEMNGLLEKMKLAAKKQQEEFEEIVGRKRQQEQMSNMEEELSENGQQDMEIEDSRCLGWGSASLFGDNYEAGRVLFQEEHSAHFGDDFSLI